MATPRKRWFRVADSIGRESWDNDTLALCIRLMAHLNTRWARDGLEGDEAAMVTLRPGDLMEISGCRRLDRARARLAALAGEILAEPEARDPLNIRRTSGERSREHPLDVAGNLTSMSVTYLGDVTEIRWRKFAEFQEWLSGGRVKSGPPHAPSASASASAPAYKKKKGADAPHGGLGREAVAAFCEAFEIKRRAKYAVEPRDAKFLKDTAQQVGLDALKAALAVYFDRTDRRITEAGWNVTALRWCWQDCHARAQEHARYLAQKARLDADPEDYDPELAKGVRL